ncbi:hypothetical protein NECAME_12125 [Necator americanus]|uniref:Uncharacterized protein n=1 Tax=Necator americanus TaxID=51031 RepID=W2T1M5_NECAM|nr:hypothetical protein NECAME_12125 [Necator americanus]ETN75783.1 hypothetical protein NECAME_12125 [Necator americanus]
MISKLKETNSLETALCRVRCSFAAARRARSETRRSLIADCWTERRQEQVGSPLPSNPALSDSVPNEPGSEQARSAGQLRIGDRIAAIAWWHVHSGAATDSANDASLPVGGAATQVGGAATAIAAATPTPPHLLIRSPTAAEFRDVATAARFATFAIAIAVIRESTSMVSRRVLRAVGRPPPPVAQVLAASEPQR